MRVEIIHRDHHHGQNEYFAVALVPDPEYPGTGERFPYLPPGERPVGYCQYSEFQNTYRVDYIETLDQKGLRSVATQILRAIVEKHNLKPSQLETGMLTDDGDKFHKLLNRRRLAQRLAGVPRNYHKIKAWLDQYRPPGSPELTSVEVLDTLADYVEADPTGKEHLYTPWLIREVLAGRLKLNQTSTEYLRKVLSWFTWLRRQSPEAVEQELGFPVYDEGWKNILSYRYSGGLQDLYRDFMESKTPLAVQYRNYRAHS